MKIMRLLVVVALVAGSTLVFAQASATPAPGPAAAAKPAPTVTSVLDRSFSGIEKEFVDAADAMPEDKYTFAPTNGDFKGVRNFSEQVKHVATTNYMIFAAMLGEKAPVDVSQENGPANVKTKAEIMKYLRDSFAYGHKAIAATNEKNLVEPIPNPFGGKNPVTRLGMVTLIVGHSFDHYGQLVEYLRMNSIIPPASRK
jgi:uncharacterized damage-inducible protein DinB